MVKENLVGILEIIVQGKKGFSSLVAKGNSELVGLTIVPMVTNIEIFGGFSSEN